MTDGGWLTCEASEQQKGRLSNHVILSRFVGISHEMSIVSYYDISAIKIIGHEKSKSQISCFTNFETLLHKKK